MAMLNNLLNISKTIIPLYQKMDTFINIKISRNSNTTVRKDILVLTVLQINNKANLSIYKIHKTNLNFIEKKGNLHNLWIKMDGWIKLLNLWDSKEIIEPEISQIKIDQKEFNHLNKK